MVVFTWIGNPRWLSPVFKIGPYGKMKKKAFSKKE
jgi:hypothetical protein